MKNIHKLYDKCFEVCGCVAKNSIFLSRSLKISLYYNRKYLLSTLKRFCVYKKQTFWPLVSFLQIDPKLTKIFKGFSFQEKVSCILGYSTSFLLFSESFPSLIFILSMHSMLVAMKN